MRNSDRNVSKVSFVMSRVRSRSIVRRVNEEGMALWFYGK